MVDGFAGILYYIVQIVLPIESITFIRAVSIITVNLLLTISTRLVYQYLYENESASSLVATALRSTAAWLTGIKIEPQNSKNSGDQNYKFKFAIVGAGRVGVMLADELLRNSMAYYKPCFFIETDKEKVG